MLFRSHLQEEEEVHSPYQLQQHLLLLLSKLLEPPLGVEVAALSMRSRVDSQSSQLPLEQQLVVHQANLRNILPARNQVLLRKERVSIQFHQVYHQSDAVCFQQLTKMNSRTKKYL